MLSRLFLCPSSEIPLVLMLRSLLFLVMIWLARHIVDAVTSAAARRRRHIERAHAVLLVNALIRTLDHSPTPLFTVSFAERIEKILTSRNYWTTPMSYGKI